MTDTGSAEPRPFAQLRAVRPGAVLLLQGGRSGALYVLKSGRLEVSRDGTVVATVEQPGAIFGEISVLLDIPHSASVQAVSGAELYVIENAAQALEARPGWMMQIAKLLAQRVLSTTAALVESQRSAGAEVFVLPEASVRSLGDPIA